MSTTPTVRGGSTMLLSPVVNDLTASLVRFHVGDKTFLLRESMHALEAKLDPDHFLRIHRSTIVQLDRVDALLREAGHDFTLKLKNGVQLMVSRSRVRAIEAWMTGN